MGLGIGKRAQDLPRQPRPYLPAPSPIRLAPEGLGPEFCLSQEITEQLGNIHHLCPGIRGCEGAIAPEEVFHLCINCGLCAHGDMDVSLKGH